MSENRRKAARADERRRSNNRPALPTTTSMSRKGRNNAQANTPTEHCSIHNSRSPAALPTLNISGITSSSTTDTTTTRITTTTMSGNFARNDAQAITSAEHCSIRNARSPALPNMLSISALTSTTNTTTTNHNTTTVMSENFRKVTQAFTPSHVVQYNNSLINNVTGDCTNTKCLTRANAPIYDVTPHVYESCSKLPNLGRLGIFSCDACDQWCQRDIICGRRITKP
jgi:hypothetical protein